MTKSIVTRYLGLAFLALAGISIVAQPVAAKDIRWKLKTGDRFKIQISQNMKQSMVTMGQTVDIPMDMGIGITWEVQKVNDDGTVELSQTIDRITMKIDAPGMGVDFDSAKDSGDGDFIGKMISDAMKPMVGVKITQKMNTRGEVLDVTIPDDALKGVANNPLLQQFFSKDALKQLGGSLVFPEGSVEKGATWENNSEAKLPPPLGSIKSYNTYTYQGEETKGDRKLDKIAVKTKMEFGKADGAFGAEIEISDQKAEGTIYFDSANGHLAESVIKQEMKMKISVAGQNIDQQQTSTMKVTVKQIK